MEAYADGIANNAVAYGGTNNAVYDEHANNTGADGVANIAVAYEVAD